MDENNIGMLRQLLIDSIPLLCRNGLPKDISFRVDAMVGITIGDQINSTLICISESVSTTGSAITGNFGSTKDNYNKTSVKEEISEGPYYVDQDDDCAVVEDSSSGINNLSVKSNQDTSLKNKIRKRKRKPVHIATSTDCDTASSFKEELSYPNNGEYAEEGIVKEEPVSAEYYDEASYEAVDEGAMEEQWDDETWSQSNWYDESAGEPSNASHYEKRYSQGYPSKKLNSVKKQRSSVGFHKPSIANAIIKNLSDKMVANSSDHGKVQCEICHLFYANPSSLQNHIRGAHVGLHNIECPICGEKFKWYMQRQRHLINVHCDKRAVLSQFKRVKS